MEESKQLLKIYIQITSTNEIIMEQCTIRQLLFKGYCDSNCFCGKIMPGGVDTQMIMKDGTGTLSARYMMEGVDMKNTPCSMYIENFAIVGEQWTTPKVLTDSENLKWMEQAALKGKIANEEEKLVIYIFE